jgi:hypothetical protein
MNLAEKARAEKPSILFILTGLGRYSWYKLPFLKRQIFCASLPRVLSMYIGRLFQWKHGGCTCNKSSCKWISVFGLYIGLCGTSRKLRQEPTQRRKYETIF